MEKESPIFCFVSKYGKWKGRRNDEVEVVGERMEGNKSDLCG